MVNITLLTAWWDSKRSGSSNKKELYKGDGYLSQRSQFVSVSPDVASVIVYDYLGRSRTIYGEHVAKNN